MRVPIAVWRPDVALFPEPMMTPYAAEVDGVYHAVDGYTPFRAHQPNSDAAAGVVRGAVAYLNKSGETTLVAGSRTKLQELNSDQTWTDLTRASGDYTTATIERWRFAQFGDTLIATNFTNAIQTLDMTSGAVFADLSGPPRARHLSTLLNSIVVGNTSNGESELYGCDQGDLSEWTVGVGSSKAWQQTLPDGGPIRAMMEADALYVFQQAAIRYVQYVGDALVVDIQVIEKNQGVSVPDSFIYYGSTAFYWAEDGVKMFSPGGGLQHIGNDKVDRWLLSTYDRGRPEYVSAALDPINKLVVWAFCSTSNPTNTPDYLLFYNYATGEFGKAQVSTQLVTLSRSIPVQLDDLNISLDSINVSFDSAQYAGGTLLFSGFDSDNKYGLFEGDTLASTLETGDFQIAQDLDAFLRSAEPIDDATGGTIAAAARQRIGDTVTYGAAKTVGTRGRAFIRGRGKYWRLRRSISAGANWGRCRGIELDWTPAGRR